MSSVQLRRSCRCASSSTHVIVGRSHPVALPWLPSPLRSRPIGRPDRPTWPPDRRSDRPPSHAIELTSTQRLPIARSAALPTSRVNIFPLRMRRTEFPAARWRHYRTAGGVYTFSDNVAGFRPSEAGTSVDVISNRNACQYFRTFNFVIVILIIIIIIIITLRQIANNRQLDCMRLQTQTPADS